MNNQTISFASGKGGSGKTIIVANIAYALSKINQKTLLIDCDFSTRGLSFFITKGLTDYQPNNCLLEYIKGDIKIGDVVPLHISDNIHLIAPTKAIEETIHFETTNPESYSVALYELLQNFKNDYSVILIDTQSGTDWKSTLACSLADLSVLVTEEDKTSFRVTSIINNLIQDLASKKNIENDAIIKKNIRRGAFILNRCVREQSEDVISFLETGLLQSKYISTILYEPKVKLAFLLDDFVLEKYPEAEFSIKICEIIDTIFKESESIHNTISKLKNEFSERKESSLKMEKRPMIRIKSLTFITMYLVLAVAVFSIYFQGLQSDLIRIFLLVIVAILGWEFLEIIRITEKR
ncbi:Iron-sulfur cluster carrier protein [uncultured archaeon]|nr:Iron-sulfur cluster carrier protein [uncultured archaeon]